MLDPIAEPNDVKLHLSPKINCVYRTQNKTFNFWMCLNIFSRLYTVTFCWISLHFNTFYLEFGDILLHIYFANFRNLFIDVTRMENILILKYVLDFTVIRPLNLQN